MKQVVNFITKHFSTALSAIYLIIVLIGMIFEYFYYKNYGINIFEYADILDFLLAPIRHVYIPVFVLLSIFLGWFFYKLLSWIFITRQKKKGKLSPELEEYFTVLYKGLFSLIGFSYIFIFAFMYGEIRGKALERSTTKIEITYTGDNSTHTAKVIGKNKDYLFLLNEGQKVEIVPIGGQIKWIKLKKEVPNK